MSSHLSLGQNINNITHGNIKCLFWTSGCEIMSIEYSILSFPSVLLAYCWCTGNWIIALPQRLMEVSVIILRNITELDSHLLLIWWIILRIIFNWNYIPKWTNCNMFWVANKRKFEVDIYLLPLGRSPALVNYTCNPFYQLGLTLNPAWINNRMYSKVWDGIIYPFLKSMVAPLKFRNG